MKFNEIFKNITSRFGRRKETTIRDILGYGSFAFKYDIYGDTKLTPHEEMKAIINAYYYNSLINASINTLNKFMIKDGLTVEANDEIVQASIENFIRQSRIDEDLSIATNNFLLTGNTYYEIIGGKFFVVPDSSRVYIDFDENLNPIKYIWELPRNAGVEGAKQYQISYYGKNNWGKYPVYGVELKNVLHIKTGFNKIPIYGRSFIASTLNDVSILYEIEKSIGILAKNRAVPKILFILKNASEMKVTQVADYLNSLNDDENAVLSLGEDFEMKDFSFSGKDINMDYMINHIRRKIISGLAPEFLLGLGSEVNRATAKEELTAFILRVSSLRSEFLKPIKSYIAKQLNISEGAFDLKFGNFEFKDEAQEKAYYLNLYNSGVITKNELREQLGFVNVPEGDEFKAPNQQPVNLFSQSYSEDLKKKIQRGITTQIDDYYKLISNLFDKEELKIELFGLYASEDFNFNKILDKADKFIGKIKERIEQKYNDIVGIVKKVYTTGAQRVYTKDGEVLKLDKAPDEKAIALIAKNQLEYLNGLTDDIRKKIKTTLLDAEQYGWSIKKTQDALTKEVSALTKARAQTIARSELIKAHNKGMLDTFKEAGVNKYVWLTAHDSKVCEVCRKLDGRKFEVGKGKLPVIDTHPNCRCTVVADI